MATSVSFFPFGLFRLRRQLECVANAALAATSRVNCHLCGHFVRRALVHKAARAAVQILGILADDDEIDILRPLVLERSLHPRKQLYRPQIDVLVQPEANIKQQLPLENAGRHIRMTDGPQEHGIELAKLIEAIFRQGFARFEIAIAAPIERCELELQVFQFADRLKNFDALSRYFGPCAVAANDGNFARAKHDRGLPCLLSSKMEPEFYQTTVGWVESYRRSDDDPVTRCARIAVGRLATCVTSSVAELLPRSFNWRRSFSGSISMPRFLISSWPMP